MMMSHSPQYFYIRVIEARDVSIRNHYYTSEPYVSLKKNGKDWPNKFTGCFPGREWWDQIFRFKIKRTNAEYINLEVRDRGTALLLVGSFWIGEVRINIRDFSDGLVHQKWFRLGNSLFKRHRRKPKGAIHLAFHLVSNKHVHPFSTPSVEVPQTFGEWIANNEKIQLRSELLPAASSSTSSSTSTSTSASKSSSSSHNSSKKKKEKRSSSSSKPSASKSSHKDGDNRRSSEPKESSKQAKRTGSEPPTGFLIDLSFTPKVQNHRRNGIVDPRVEAA